MANYKEDEKGIMIFNTNAWEQKGGNIFESATDYGDVGDNETLKKGWKILSGLTDYKNLSDDDRKTLQEMAFQKYHLDPVAHGVIENLLVFVIGRGINYVAEDENPLVQKKCDEFWKDPENTWDLRIKELIRRVTRDGEVFLRWFKVGDGRLVCRFIEPSKIKEIKYENEGTANEDVEKPILYIRTYLDSNHTEQEEKIPADQIDHIKLNCDSDEQRGRPFIEVIMKSLARYEDFARNRAMINKGRSCFVLEKIVDGSPDSVSSVTAGMTTLQGGGKNLYTKRMPKPGTVLVHNKSIEYKFNSLNINADDAKEDGRLFRLNMACAMLMPEYMFGDASNANYASSLVAESPFVRRVEDLQETFRYHIKKMFERVIKYNITIDNIPAMSNELIVKESFSLHIKLWKKLKSFFHLRESIKDERFVEQDGEIYQRIPCPTKTEVDIEFPPLVHRNIKEETEAVQIHSAMGWVSNETASAKFGYDYLEEKRKIIQEESEGKDEAGTELDNEIMKENPEEEPKEKPKEKPPYQNE